MFRKKAIIFFLVFVLSLTAHSQTVDSLKNAVNSMSDDSVKVATLYKIAVSQYRSNPDEMLDYAQQSLELAKKLEIKTEIAKSYHILGIYYANNADLQRALDYFFKSLDVLENSNDEKRKGVVFGAIARVYQMMNNNLDALKYDTLALDIAIKNNDTLNLATNYNNVGADYYNLMNYNEALKNYNFALLLAEKYNNKQLQGALFMNIGYSYLNNGNLDSSYIYYKKSKEFYTQNADRYGLANISGKLAEYYNQINNPDSVYFYASKSYVLANQLGLVSIEKNASKLLQEFFYAEKIIDSAYFYQSIFYSLRDSINSSDNTKKITQLEMQYNFDKEKEIDKIRYETKVAKQKNIKLFFIVAFILSLILVVVILKSYRQKKKSELKLQKLNATKDKFFGIISHDLKGPFSAFISISEILSNPDIELSKEKIQYFASSINKSAKSSYDLFQNLLLWSMSQRENLIITKSEINLKKIIDEVFDLLRVNANSKKISLLNNINEDVKIISDENIIKTIVRNLVNNAIKFTNENGEVKISGSFKDDIFLFSVTDTGVGISEEKVKNIFRIDNQESTVGTKNEKGTGLGLVLCKELITRLDGNILVKSKLAEGSEFIVSIPNVK